VIAKKKYGQNALATDWAWLAIFAQKFMFCANTFFGCVSSTLDALFFRTDFTNTLLTLF
jgi:hypothetical protein